MQKFNLYYCDSCGFGREKAGICPFCQVPLSVYNREVQNEYQTDVEEPMRVISEYKWYA